MPSKTKAQAQTQIVHQPNLPPIFTFPNVSLDAFTAFPSAKNMKGCFHAQYPHQTLHASIKPQVNLVKFHLKPQTYCKLQSIIANTAQAHLTSQLAALLNCGILKPALYQTPLHSVRQSST
jgi:hypothetical protein